MRGRIMNDYWVFPEPIGYRYEGVKTRQAAGAP